MLYRTLLQFVSLLNAFLRWLDGFAHKVRLLKSNSSLEQMTVVRKFLYSNIP